MLKHAFVRSSDAIECEGYFVRSYLENRLSCSPPLGHVRCQAGGFGNSKTNAHDDEEDLEDVIETCALFLDELRTVPESERPRPAGWFESGDQKDYELPKSPKNKEATCSAFNLSIVRLTSKEKSSERRNTTCDGVPNPRVTEALATLCHLTQRSPVSLVAFKSEHPGLTEGLIGLRQGLQDADREFAGLADSFLGYVESRPIVQDKW